jgi:uncharacterized protein (UPF0335 family)
MTMSPEQTAADQQLLSIVQRIEALEEQIKGLNDDKSGVYDEARSNGFDVKILRKLIAERRKSADVRSEEQAILELYRDALARAEEPRARNAHARAA